VKALYVEVLIRADMDALWELTQNPTLHPQWDLRFSSISPEAGAGAGGARFRYSRRLPFHTIIGRGISVGEVRRPDGTRTSALRFDTDDPFSPLRQGRGYWRYVPTADGIRFITGYDYAPGFGRLADRLLRPFISWMTAWSFDRLRIWAETGTLPRWWQPRAGRCITTPPPRGAMHDAPAALATLEAP
jgi:hypothetical protein